MCLCQCERRDFSASNAREILLFLLLCAEQEERLGDSDRLMRRNKCRHVSVPTPKQNCGPSVIALRQTESAIFLWHLIPNAPISASPLKFSGGISPVRSISSGSTWSRK